MLQHIQIENEQGNLFCDLRSSRFLRHPSITQ